MMGKIVKQRKNKIKPDLFRLYSLCLIPVLLVFIFCYVPMAGIILAFKNYKYDLGIFGSEWVGFDNFKYLLSTSDFARITWNTLSMNLLFIVLGILAALIVAVFMYDLVSRKLTKIFQTILITPNFVSWVVCAYIVYGFLNPAYGIVNKFLEAHNIATVDWYATPSVWPVILIVASIWKHVGIDSVVYYAALMGIDETLFEAARIDGATRWQRVRYIMIPSLTSLLVVLTILKIGNIFRADFGLFYQVPRNVGTLYKTTDVIDTYIYRQMRIIGDMKISSAMGLLQSAVGFVCVVITNKIAKKIDPDSGLF